MTVKEISCIINADICGGKNLAGEVNGCYIGDLLSLAMSRCQEKNAWITIQTNVNVTAVAVLTGAACVIVCDDHKPDVEMIQKAEDENIPILCSSKTAYEIASCLYDAGI